MECFMKHGWKFFCTALLIFASFSLEAASQSIEPMFAQQLAAQLTSTHDFTIWLLIAAGCVGLVVARKRI